MIINQSENLENPLNLENLQFSLGADFCVTFVQLIVINFLLSFIHPSILFIHPSILFLLVYSEFACATHYFDLYLSYPLQYFFYNGYEPRCACG